MKKKKKYCPKCTDTKPLTEFHKSKSRSDGVHGICKACTNRRRREKYSELTPEETENIKAKREIYRSENKAKIKDTVERYSKEHVGEIKKNQKKWNDKNPDYHKPRLEKQKIIRRFNGITDLVNNSIHTTEQLSEMFSDIMSENLTTEQISLFLKHVLKHISI